MLEKKTKIILNLFLVFLGLFMSGRVIYRFFKGNKEINNSLNGGFADLRIQELVKEPESFQPVEGVFYDFKKMVRLIDASRKAWSEVTPTFDDPKKQKDINREYVTGILRELLHERVKLRNYIFDLKGYSQSGISIKKQRSLQYYLEIIENNIVDMRTLLRKREL